MKDRLENFTLAFDSTAADVIAVGAFVLPGRWEIVSAALYPTAAVSADATNVTQLVLTNQTQSQIILDHDTTTGQEGALSQYTAATSGFSSVSAEGLIVEEGDVFTLTKTDGGTGATVGAVAALQLRQRQG